MSIIENFSQYLIGFLIGIPVWGILGWVLSRIFGPSADELGAKLKGWIFVQFSHNEYLSYVAFTKLEKLLSDLHKNGHNRFNDNKPYLHGHEINLEIKRHTAKQLQDIASVWIRHGRIWSYAASDIFFAGMELLLQNLSKENIQEIFEKHRENNQASVCPFLEIVEKQRPSLLSAEVLRYLRDEQQKYEERIAKRLNKTTNENSHD